MSKTQPKTGMRGEPGSPERRAFYQAIGRKGGNRNKQRFLDPKSPDYDPYHFEKLGQLAGEKMKKRGKEYFSRIGKIGKKEAQ